LSQLSKEHSRLVGFDISNLVKDTELIATSTKNNLSRLHRRMALRLKYQGTEKLEGSTDFKIWYYLVKSFSADVDYQVENIKKVLTVLDKLEKGSFKIKTDADHGASGH